MRWSPATIKQIQERAALGPLLLTVSTEEEARSLRNALYRRLRGFAIHLTGRTLDIRPLSSIAVGDHNAYE